MNLYEIAQEYLSALETIDIDPETGEVLNMDALDALEGAFDAKAEAIGCYIKDLEAGAAAIKAEGQNLSARRMILEKKADRLRRYLAEMMTAVGRDKVQTPRCALSFRKSEQVRVFDLQLLAEDYIREKVTRDPDKTAIKQALKDGKTVAGAELVAGRNLQIK